MKEERQAVPEQPAAHAGDDARAPLFHDEELAGYRSRWSGIQTGFVDEPRLAVSEADALVSELTTRLKAVMGVRRQAVRASAASRA